MSDQSDQQIDKREQVVDAEKNKVEKRIEYRRLLRILEYAIEERERQVSSSHSIQQAIQHEVEMTRVRPARNKLDQFVAKLIG